MKRIAKVTGGLLAAVGVAAIGLSTLVGPTASADSTTSGGFPDIEWPPPGTERPHHSADELRAFGAAMSEHLDTAFPAVVPAAEDVKWAPWGGEAAGDISDGQDYLTTWSMYEDEIGSTGQSFQVNAPGLITRPPEKICEEPDTLSCKGKELADGSVLVTDVSKAGNGMRLRTAWHYRTDGSVVSVTAYNYDPAGGGPVRDEIALTSAQLAKLATDPALHL